MPLTSQLNIAATDSYFVVWGSRQQSNISRVHPLLQAVAWPHSGSAADHLHCSFGPTGPCHSKANFLAISLMPHPRLGMPDWSRHTLRDLLQVSLLSCSHHPWAIVPIAEASSKYQCFPVRDTYWCNPRRVFHLLQHFPFACIARPAERNQTKLLFVSENRTGLQTVAEK